MNYRIFRLWNLRLESSTASWFAWYPFQLAKSGSMLHPRSDTGVILAPTIELASTPISMTGSDQAKHHNEADKGMKELHLWDCCLFLKWINKQFIKRCNQITLNHSFFVVIQSLIFLWLEMLMIFLVFNRGLFLFEK